MFLALAVLAVSRFQSPSIPLIAGVGISGVSQGGRAPVGIDSVQSLLVDGKWTEPKAGDKIGGTRGAERTWAEVKGNKDGVFEGGPTNGGYIDVTSESDAEKPMLLLAAGDTMVYINGVPRAGDPYGYGYLKIPFLMKKGHNEFLFSCGRGSLKASLQAPESPLMLNPGDMTLPDLRMTTHDPMFGGVPIVNATNAEVTDLVLGARVGDGQEVRMQAPRMGPMSVTKCPFRIEYGSLQPGDISLQVNLYHGHNLVSSTITSLSVKTPIEHYKQTFLSQIDDSVQYYGVCPSLKPAMSNALILTVHGASVEGIGQARAYAPKDWCTIVAATNRRPYGFDWEDWGRMDAMEVLKLAKHDVPHDPKRVILTGHSMGGHGTWTLGLTYPNEFAAIGPSAGWISFWSYAGGWTPQEPNPVEQMLRRSMNSSDTLLMLNNAKMEDIFILHGDKDDNVPVEQAREMKKHLTDIGVPVQYHEQPGAGHWWGNECVDWPPMFEMFNKARLPDPAGSTSQGRKWSFTTVNPGVSNRYDCVIIDQQEAAMLPSVVTMDAGKDGWSITTANVARFQLSPPDGHSPTTLRVDGQLVWHSPVEGGSLLAKSKDGWAYRPATIERQAKWHQRTGPFKLAFQNWAVFVVGTHGTAEENEWAVNKARFDAETWYYKGNGRVDIVRDDEVDRYRNRNLILYGNADTNSAFRLIANCPLKLKRGSVSLGDHSLTGNDLAALYLYPEGMRLIGVVGGTGLAGMRYTDRLPYFTSGVAYPDWTILPASDLIKGSKGILGAGFFGNDWKFDPKQSAFEGR